MLPVRDLLEDESEHGVVDMFKIKEAAPAHGRNANVINRVAVMTEEK